MLLFSNLLTYPINQGKESDLFTKKVVVFACKITKSMVHPNNLLKNICQMSPYTGTSDIIHLT